MAGSTSGWTPSSAALHLWARQPWNLNACSRFQGSGATWTLAEKANGLTASAFYSLGRNDLLGNILYSGCSAGELLTFRDSHDR